MRKFRRVMSPLSPLLAMMLLLVACGADDDPDPTPALDTGADPDADTDSAPDPPDVDELYEITIAMASSGIAFLQPDVAETQGFYEDHNLVVEMLPVEGSAAATAAVESGQADIMISLPEGVITAQAAGSIITMIGATVDENLWRLFVSEGIESLEDLAGESLAMFIEGNGTDIQLRWLLDEHGAGHELSTFVALGGAPPRLAALIEGQVAGTLLFPPGDVLADRAGLPSIATFLDYVDGYPHEVISASRERLDEDPEAFRAFMAAMEDATEWLRDEANTEPAIDLAVEVTGDERDVVEEAFLFTRPTFATRIRPEGLEWTLEVMERYIEGFELPDIDELYDDSFHP